MGYTDQGIGYQKTDTSKAAAMSGAAQKLTLRDQVYNLLQSSSLPLSSEQIASTLRRPYGSIQPRISELRKAGKIDDSGSRGKSEWGKSCILWEVCSHAA